MNLRHSIALAAITLLSSSFSVRADDGSTGGGGPAGGAFMSSYSPNVIWTAPPRQVQPVRPGAWEPATTASTRARFRTRRR